MKGKLILNQITPYQQGKQIKDIKEAYGLERIVKLASNENPYGYSPYVKDYFTTNVPAFENYPDGYTADLRTAIASKLDIGEDQLLFGSGSEEIVQIICRAFLYPGVNTVVPAPTFPQYKHNALIEGATIKEIPTVDGFYDLERMLESIDENTNVVWLCSPNNPTGTSIPKKSLYSFMDGCPEDVLVVLDEAYYEYMEADQDPEAITNLPNYKNLVILRTFSKAYGLAGLRIGYAIANPSLITKLDVIRGPFNTTSLAQQAALIAWEDEEFIKETISKNEEVKQSFKKFLDTIGWSYYNTQTNFLLVSTPISGNDVFQYLIENGFIVRPGEVLGYPNTIRITLGNDKDMKQLQNVLYTLHQQTSKET